MQLVHADDVQWLANQETHRAGGLLLVLQCGGA